MQLTAHPLEIGVGQLTMVSIQRHECLRWGHFTFRCRSSFPFFQCIKPREAQRLHESSLNSPETSASSNLAASNLMSSISCERSCCVMGGSATGGGDLQVVTRRFLDFMSSCAQKQVRHPSPTVPIDGVASQRNQFFYP